MNMKQSKKIIQKNATTDTIIQRMPSIASHSCYIEQDQYHVPFRSSVRSIPHGHSAEHEGTTLKRTTQITRKFTNSHLNALPLSTGGIFPEDAKVGLRYTTTQRPKDNTDIFDYVHAGAITESRTTQHQHRQQARQAYEAALKDALKENHETNSKMYTFFKARRNLISKK